MNEKFEFLSPSQQLFKRCNEPFVYLYVSGRWYCYDPNKPPLGAGSMGTVFLGYDVLNSTQVAIKRVKDQYANVPQIRARARQEASLAFRHPNLIETIGYCEWERNTGPLFVVSKYVSGEDSNTFVKKNFSTPELRIKGVCDIIKMVLQALEYIHSRGVIHRDIKPSNIMIEGGHNARLMDLGIARLSNGNQFSKYGFIGTPQYAAPEQIYRDKEHASDIDRPTDFYALGITFYELLTGNNPFDSSVDSEVLVKQMNEKLPMNKAIPVKLMRVILKATEKDPARRYHQASEMSDAIDAALEDKPTLWEEFKNYVRKLFNL